MASTRFPSSAKDSSDGPSLQEIIFSCGICQATVPEVYAQPESNHGFHSGPGDEAGIVTRLWIGDCSHVMCGKHLEAGAAPFHPKGTQPRAPCPQCQEKGDDSPKGLYSIRGLIEGEYDARIPSSWMRCPPIRLDGGEPGLDALRFQYTSLTRYARRVTKRRKDAQQKLNTAEAAMLVERKRRQQLQAKVLRLTTQVNQLGQAEAQLKKWESRKKVINHYLGAVGEMAKEIEIMRSQLEQLGYRVPKRSYIYKPDQAERSKTVASSTDHEPDPDNGEIFGSSSTKVPTLYGALAFPRKRKLAEYDMETVEGRQMHHLQLRGNRRDLMPPPLPANISGHRQVSLTVRPDDTQLNRQQPSTYVFADHSLRNADHQQGAHNLMQWQHDTPSQQVLPLRSSPVNGESLNRAREVYSASQHANHHDEALPIAALSHQHSAKPPAQLPFWSAQHQQDAFHSQADMPPPRQYAQHQSDVGMAERLHNVSIRHHENADSQPQRELLTAYPDRQPALPLGTRRPPYTPFTQQQGGHAKTPVASPFFKRNGPTATERPPTVDYRNRSQYSTPRRDIATAYNTASTLNMGSHVSTPRQMSDLAYFVDRLQRPSDRQPQIHPPAYLTIGNDHQVRASMDLQTPRKTEGFLQRPDRAPSTVDHAPNRAQPTASRSRVSLPAGIQQSFGMARTQEQALSQIRGVRGTGSRGFHTRTHETSSSYGPVRTLHSSFGNRRSVRR